MKSFNLLCVCIVSFKKAQGGGQQHQHQPRVNLPPVNHHSNNHNGPPNVQSRSQGMYDLCVCVCVFVLLSFGLAHPFLELQERLVNRLLVDRGILLVELFQRLQLRSLLL